ncbi:hypothetical protein GTQ99_16930 [Kineococcus sp. T13]|uniref:hypothetical protein n=1 Tax=Kineococcus vitellinus TaxID=2696565 RepID=UPI001412C854|nr:hypothetical protein [Kineococcus vitellinus]NAZ77091.1 hypothetical protein [Kineococcus vitellinus]
MAPAHEPSAAPRASRHPTRKWLVAQITALGALLTLLLTTGGWGAEENVALVGYLVQALTTYLVPNLDTPGGVPLHR